MTPQREEVWVRDDTGRLPFLAKRVAALVRKIMSTPPPPPSAVSRGIARAAEAICQKMLA